MKNNSNFYENNPPLRLFAGLNYSIRSKVFATKEEAQNEARQLKTEIKKTHKINLLVKTVRGLDCEQTPCFINYQYLGK